MVILLNYLAILSKKILLPREDSKKSRRFYSRLPEQKKKILPPTEGKIFLIIYAVKYLVAGPRLLVHPYIIYGHASWKDRLVYAHFAAEIAAHGNI